MKKHIQLAWNRLNISKIGNLIDVPLLMVLLLCFFSCSQEAEQQVVLSNQPTQILTVDPADLPPPIKARYIDPDSVSKPMVVPLKGKPKVVPAHMNVHPAGTPQVIRIPNDLTIVTPGKEGIPVPLVIPVKINKVPALQPKPIPALAPRFTDDAVFNINYLSDEEGLPFAGRTLLEDGRGNIWIGGKGVIRYDGENFFRYTEKEGFLKGNVNTITEDSKGNIWFAGQSGICYYDGQNVFHFVEDESFDSYGCRIVGCKGIIEDRKGNIWFGNVGAGKDGSGVYCFDGKNLTVFREENGVFNDGKKEIGYIFENRINALFNDSQGHLWWATQGSGVMRYDGQNIIHYTEKEGLIDNYIGSITEDKEGRIWFGSGGNGTFGRGLSCYQRDTSSPFGKGGTFTNYTTQEGLSDGRITGLVNDEVGDLWISTFRGGINRFDGKSFTHFKTTEGLGGNRAYSILRDHKNNIWANTIGGRLSCIKPNSFKHFTDKQGLNTNDVRFIIEDSKDNIWMATTGGLIKYDGNNFTTYTEEEGLPQNLILSLLEDSKGNIWMATRDKGICKFDGKDFTIYTPDQGLSGVFWWDLHEDQQGQIWVACGSLGGISRLNSETGQFTQFTGIENLQTYNNFDGDVATVKGIGGASIREDSQHNLWFGAAGWVAKHDPQKDQINFMYPVDTINNEYVDLLVEDDENNLWFGGATHFIKIKKNDANTSFPLFTKGNGLPNMNLNSFAIDKNKNVWVGSQGIGLFINGIKKLGSSNLDWIQFDKADGLKTKSYHFISCIDSKNRLWVGSGAGVTMLDLNSFKLPTEAPNNLSLSHIDLQGQFLDYRNLSNENYTSILAFGATASQSFDSLVAYRNYPQNLNLSYDLNHLTFHFSAIDWAAPHKIQYSYLIKGIDKEWSEPNAETKADYRNLPHGTFTFKVKAIGEAQVWSEPFSYTFTIQPPWWHTWWAYALYALLAFGVFGWYIQRLRRQINQKQKQLDREHSLNLQLATSNQQLAVTNKQLEDTNIANSRFVPKDFLHILGKDSLLDLQLGDQTEATMTILFADIRGYTTLSEKMTPEQNFKFINAFLGRMGPIIQKNGGFISQYLGDGIMALFKGNHELAIKASIEIQQALQRYNKKRFVRNRQALRLGIGLNTGKLMLGVIGDKNRYESGVISDAVNTASRMEGLTKAFGCSVIVSEKTLAEIESQQKTDHFSISSSPSYRFLGKVKVKGKNQALKIYDCFAGDLEYIQEKKVATKVDFEAAVDYYFDRKFGKAADLFKAISEAFPEDVATEYYLTKAIKYVMDGVDADWSGVEEMVSK